MDNELRDFLQSIIDLEFEEKVELGRDALASILNNLPSYNVSEENISAFAFAATKLFVSADLDCNQSEYDFFRAVTGIDIEPRDFYDLTNEGRDKQFVSDFMDLIKELTYEDRKHLIMYGVALLSCDNVLKVDEIKLIDMIFKA